MEMTSKYKQVFDNTGQYVGLLDTNGTLVEANETALEFGGLDREDVIGKKIWETYWFRHSTDVQRQIRDDVRRAASGEPIRRELEVQGAERTTIVDNSVRPLFDDRGDVTHVVSEGYCISQLRRKGTREVPFDPERTRSDLLVSYTRSDGETMNEAILRAFLAVNIDIFEKDSTLHELIDIDALNGFAWDSKPPHVITTQLWGYEVHISADEIEIYTGE